MHHIHAHHVIAAIAVTHGMLVLHPHLAAAMTRFTRTVKAAVSAAGAALARRRKVSVVTPTWQRHELLTGRCVPSVRSQDYDGEVEHVIVSDGPDAALEPLGAHFLPGHASSPNRGVLARRRGAELATGELVAYLDDDNAFRPQHVRLLAAALEASPWAGFAYSRAMCQRGRDVWVIGGPVPECGQIDTSLIVHRRELLAAGSWEETATAPADWDLVERWMAAGVKWAYVPEITLDYYARLPAWMRSRLGPRVFTASFRPRRAAADRTDRATASRPRLTG